MLDGRMKWSEEKRSYGILNENPERLGIKCNFYLPRLNEIKEKRSEGRRSGQVEAENRGRKEEGERREKEEEPIRKPKRL